jgi:glycine/D-amino acid oxidase-like deaminating enzyme
MRTETADVIVVGAGIVGCACAHYLAEKGLKVRAFDCGDLAEGASGACEGFLSLQSKAPGEALAMARESVGEYRTLGERLRADVEFRPTGGMTVLADAASLRGAADLAGALDAAGVRAEVLSTEDALALAPPLSPRIAGAIYCPEEGLVNPWSVVRAFASSATRQGAAFALHTRVEGVLISRGRVTGVLAHGVGPSERGSGAGQRWGAGLVVLAAGLDCARLGRGLGLDIPVRPRRGQVLVTEKVPAMLEPFLLGPSYVSSKLGAGTPEGGAALAVAQTAAGNFQIGGTREFVGEDPGTTPAGMTAIAREACELAPGIAHLAVIRAFAGLRPYADRHVPIIERYADPAGLIVATGHGGDGVCLAPATGRRVVELAGA